MLFLTHDLTHSLPHADVALLQNQHAGFIMGILERMALYVKALYICRYRYVLTPPALKAPPRPQRYASVNGHNLSQHGLERRQPQPRTILNPLQPDAPHAPHAPQPA